MKSLLKMNLFKTLQTELRARENLRFQLKYRCSGQSFTNLKLIVYSFYCNKNHWAAAPDRVSVPNAIFRAGSMPESRAVHSGPRSETRIGDARPAPPMIDYDSAREGPAPTKFRN